MKVFSIGRIATNDIVLTDQMVSRQHAQLIILDNERVMIKDTGSSNGTYVNGNKVSECYLEAGDIVKCGGTFLNWSQYVSRSYSVAPPMQKPDYQQQSTNYQSDQPDVKDAPLPQFSFGLAVKYLTTRIFQVGDLFKTEWDRTPSILFFILMPLGLFLVTLLYFYSKIHYDFLYQVFLPLILVLLVFGVSQFLTLSLLSINRNTIFIKNLFASSIYSFLQFCQLLVFALYFIIIANNIISTHNPFNNFNGPTIPAYFILALLLFTILISISITLLIFLFKYFRITGVSKSMSIHYVVISMTVNFLIQAGLVYFFIAIAGKNIFNF
jgi:hypothetical protein